MLKKFNSKEVDIWFTSDIHAFHKNITRGESEWSSKDNGLRDFDTIQKMTDTIINGINKYVKPNDILFDLGDWSFGGIEKIWELRSRIVCRNIYKVCGNHDLKIIKNQLLPNCHWDIELDIIVNGKNPMIYSDNRNGMFNVYAQELFIDVSFSDLIQIDKKLVYISHFPCEEVRYDKSSIHLHGHTHGKLGNQIGRLDVGIDNAYKLFNEYRPFHWDDIKRISNRWLN